MDNYTWLQKNGARWAKIEPLAAEALLKNGQDLICSKVKGGGKRLQACAPSSAVAIAEAEALVAGLKPDGANLLYLFGLGQGEVFQALKVWLDHENHHLVIFEGDLSVIARVLERELGQAIVFHPRVFLLLLDPTMASIERATELFIGVPYALVATDSYRSAFPKTFADLQTRLDYLSSARMNFLGEHRSGGYGFFYNYLRNLFLWPSSFLGSALFNRFKGFPAIICGAGPSLGKQAALLKQYRDRALIFAGGTAMNGVNAFSLLPHIGVGIDPNMAQLSRIIMNTAYETPFFYRCRMYTHALKQIQGPLLQIPGSSGYRIAEFFERELGLAHMNVSEGHNVINFSLSIALALGCNPIILVGVDLAYTNGESYSPGVLSHPVHHQKELFFTKDLSEELVLRNDIYGNPVSTLWKWVNESLWFSTTALANPSVQLINATEGGIGFYEIPNMPLSTAIEKHTERTYDYDLMLYGAIQSAPMPPQVTYERIVLALQKMLLSLERAIAVIGAQKPSEQAIALNQESSLAQQLVGEDSYTYVLGEFEQTFRNVRKRELWRLEHDKDVMSEAEWQSKNSDFQRQELLFLKEVAVSLAKQIKEVLEKQGGLQSRPGVVSLERAQECKTTIASQYHFDAQRFEIHDPDLLLDYKEEFNDQNFLTAEKSLYPNEELRMVSHRRGPHLHGPSIFYAEDGIMLGATWFVEGKRQGKSQRYYASGALYALLTFKDDHFDGVQRYYYEDGSLRSEISYRMGVLDGAVALFHPQGRAARELHFEAGKREGRERIFSPSGQLLIEAFFSHDLPVGTARVWHENGALAYENKYDDAAVNVQIWDDKGRFIVQNPPTDYFQDVACDTHKLTAEIVNSFEALKTVIFSLVPPEKKEEVDSVLSALNNEIARLKELDHQIAVESGLVDENQKEKIWKTPSAKLSVEAQVEVMTMHITAEFLKLQSMIVSIIENAQGAGGPGGPGGHSGHSGPGERL